MQFKTHSRLGIKALILQINTKAQISVRSDYDSSFGVRAAQLWNIFPSDVSQLNSLESFKIGFGRFLEQFPDTPPVPGYTAVNNNSLLSRTETRNVVYIFIKTYQHECVAIGRRLLYV